MLIDKLSTVTKIICDNFYALEWLHTWKYKTTHAFYLSRESSVDLLTSALIILFYHLGKDSNQLGSLGLGRYGKNRYDTYCDTHKAIRNTYWRYDTKVNIKNLKKT